MLPLMRFPQFAVLVMCLSEMGNVEQLHPSLSLFSFSLPFFHSDSPPSHSHLLISSFQSHFFLAFPVGPIRSPIDSSSSSSGFIPSVPYSFPAFRHPFSLAVCFSCSSSSNSILRKEPLQQICLANNIDQQCPYRK
jgi:hypothetical protein